MREHIRTFLLSSTETLMCFQKIENIAHSDDELVRTFVEHIRIGECSGYGSIADAKATRPSVSESDDEEIPPYFLTNNVKLSIHVYQLQKQGAVEEYGNIDSSDIDESVMMAHHWTLPCEELEGIWDSLIFKDRLEIKLLEYVYTTILFSDRNVNPHLVSWNRVVLLHGPPGTGKTSLCRGLAQTLGIRLSKSLFSKWFSESGKLVQRMFDQIWRMVDDDETFVCVLIDEVESLAAARKAALSGNEPSDSIRVVNALLTQIDRLKKKRNVLILATSNITEAIDIAFIDRADIKMYIGLPPPKAIYNILCSSLNELRRAGIIHATYPLPERNKRQEDYHMNDGEYAQTIFAQTSELMSISSMAHGMSGRAVRKLPFLAHANHLQIPVSPIAAFLNALRLTVEEEQQCNAQLRKSS
ncbi:Pachytene checkpoint protein 2 [Linnemannia zychae]|nr:Pachytene checkpoint protein 2 [Linnemannia zychae]